MKRLLERIKPTVKRLTPPVLWDLVMWLKNGRGRIWHKEEWEYVPEGWAAAESDPAIRGWNVEAILEAYRRKWPEFLRSLESTKPFGLSPEAIVPGDFDLVYHNTIMCFGYALARAARRKNLVSMLDWGGGIGHYLLIARRLLPEVEFRYHCKDVPVLAAYGQKLFPEATFISDDSCLAATYDFVLASTSLHYSPDWRSVLAGLAKATAGFLLITRLPIVLAAESYVFVQRPYHYGYDTEYLGWSLNRREFLEAAAESGLALEREFVTGEQPHILRAPEQCRYRAFLFRREPAVE